MKEVLTSILRTPYQSLAAFLILYFTLFFSSVMFVSLAFLYGLLGYVETRPQVTVYFQSNAKEEEIFSLREKLKSSGKVEQIKYISKSDAFKIYKELNKDNPLLLEMVSSDILPASLEIFAKKPTFLPEIAEFLQKQPGVDEVNFQKDIVDQILRLTGILRKISLTFFIFLIVISFLVLNTITLFKIALKKEEIEVMRLLGASNFYIQKPFLSEGILFGLLASSVSFVLISGTLFYLSPFFNEYFKGIPTISLSFDFMRLIVWPINLSFLLILFMLSSLFGTLIAILSTDRKS